MRASDQVLASYAEAFIETVDPKRWEPLLGEFRLMVELFGSFEELEILLETPLISLSDRSRILDRLLDTVDVSTEMRSLFHVLLKNRRLLHIDKISLFLEEEISFRKKRIVAYVRSTTDLRESDLAAMRKIMEDLTKKQVELRTSRDASVLGGIVIETEDMVYDGSLRNRLSKLYEAIAGRKTEAIL